MSDPTTISPARSNEEEPIVHLRLGDQEIWILPDALLVQDTKLYALEASKEELENLLSQTGLSDQLRLWVCPILVKSGTDYILIDTGIGLHVPGMAGALPQKLASIGIEPEQISKIFITHLHADHIGGAFAPPTGQPLFPNATIYVPEAEVNFWKNPDLSYLKRNVPPELVELTVRIAQSAIEHLPITTFSFGAPLFPGIEPVPLPGHTAGQAGYLLADPNSEQQFMIGGDVCHNPTLHVSHPEWTTMGDSHPHLVRQTRLQLLSRIADKNIVFRCYHFAPGENGFIRPESGDRFRFVRA